MKLKKVKKYKKPDYPSKELFIVQPQLLGTSIPTRWLKSKALMGALMAFIVSGCRDNFYSRQSSQPAQEISPEKATAPSTAKVQKEEAKIAPIFIHGDGQGATGCVVVSPPAFLSEAEGINIIFDELKKENISFEKRDIVLPNFFVQEHCTYHNKTKSVDHPFLFDGFSTKYKIGFKFISRDNYYQLGRCSSEMSVQSWDTIGLAVELKDKLADFNQANAVIFYDPLLTIPEDDSINPCQSGQEFRACHRELLRNQVRDFIEWLKSEFIKDQQK